jgi:NitT/TauT family transport system substrate-binding protein
MLPQEELRMTKQLLQLALPLALLVAACAPTTAVAPTSPPTTGAAAPATTAPAAAKPPTSPADKMQLVFGGAVTPPSMVHLPPYVAKAMGFFDEVGLDVEIKSFEGGVGALRGGISGGLDIVATSSDPLFAAIQQGAPVKAIGTYAPKLSVVMMAAPDVKSPKDLKGKKLGIQEVGGFNDVMSRLVLQGAGISPNDVQFVNVATANRVTSMVQGQTDATVLHIDQYYAALAANSNFNVLAKMWEVVPDWWYSAFVATDDVRTQKREAVVRFMTAVIKAQRFMYTNPVETKKIAVDETKRKPEEVDKAYDDLVRGGIWSVNDGMPQKLIDYTIGKEVEVGVVKPDNRPTYEQIVEKSIVDEAIKRNGGGWTGDPRWY